MSDTTKRLKITKTTRYSVGNFEITRDADIHVVLFDHDDEIARFTLDEARSIAEALTLAANETNETT